MARGGRRPGAGRKPGVTNKRALKLDPETTAILSVLRNPENAERLLATRLQRKGLTRDQFQKMLSEQGGRCAVCNEPLSSRWVIDHCHLTMKVRGLLHSRCNTMIGLANEDPRRLEQAIVYLKKHNKFL